MSPKFYTVAQVAQLLQVSQKTVRRAIKRGDLLALRFAGSIRIPSSELEKVVRAA